MHSVEAKPKERTMSRKHELYVILAAIDYTETGRLALERALELGAEKRAAALHVVHAIPALQALDAAATLAGVTPNSSQVAALRLKTYVEDVVDRFRAARGVELPFLELVVAHQLVDAPAEGVAQLAADLEADLVVVGTHGRRGLTRLILGSVAEATTRLAPCPVLVVRPKAVPVTGPALTPPCPRCLEARAASGGKELWCEQHRERHGRRHTYHQSDRVGADTNIPLVMHS
jgi:nucleotide-binding universal stress UspA family protein